MADGATARYLNVAGRWPGFEQRRGLTIDPDGALALIRVPGATDVLGAPIPAGLAAEPAGLSSDAAGNLYLGDPPAHRVLRLDGCTGASAPLPGIGGEGGEPGRLRGPRGVLVGPRRALYVADSGNHRIQVVDLETGQLRARWGQPDPWAPPEPGEAPGRFTEPWDLAADGTGMLYVVERAGRRVQKLDPAGRVVAGFWDRLAASVVLDRPTNVAVGPAGAGPGTEPLLYLLDAGPPPRVLLVTLGGEARARWDLPADVVPVGVVATAHGVYVGDGARGRILAVALAGQVVGAVPDYRGPVAGLALGCDGRLLVYPGGGESVARLRPGAAALRSGDVLAGPFEAGPQATEWHRVRALAEPLAEETHVQLFILTTATPDPVELGPEADPFPGFRAVPPDVLDALVLAPPARCLWLGARLQGNGRASPRLLQVQLTYPPETSLRHLPAIYREDESGRRFLERLLAWLESVSGGLDEQVSDLALLFDPLAAPRAWALWLAGWREEADRTGRPGDWLAWLAGWLALDVDQAWTDAEARQAVAEAFALHGMRGTIEGLRRRIRVHVGIDAHVEEPGRRARRWALGGTRALGFHSVLSPTAPAAVLGTTAALDASHVADPDAGDRGIPDAAAFRFCVLVYRADLRGPRTSARLAAVVEREKPAHTDWHLCVLEARMRVGFQARIGIDAIVGGPAAGLSLEGARPLGTESVLGGPIAERGGAVSRGARLGVETRLT